MISFIVIGKNEERHLNMCFSSIYNLVKEDNIDSYEIIYVDSKSTDKSVEIALSFNGIHVYVIEGECNAAIARNIGANEAKGDILFFLDGDMKVLPGFLPKVMHDNKLVYPFISGLLVDFVYDSNWNYLYKRIRDKIDKDTYQVLVGGLFIIEKHLWNSIEGMDTRQKRSQDFDLALRLSSKGYKLLRKADLLAEHYMISYYERKDIVSRVRYTALLLRKHFFSSIYWMMFVRTNYRVILLLFSLIFAIFISPWVILLYFIVLLYNARNVGFKMMCNFCLRDIFFMFSFFFFFPQKKELLYKKLN